MELSGVHIGRKVEITWIGPRANPPRKYKKHGVIREVRHLAPKGKTLYLEFSDGATKYSWGPYLRYRWANVPFYAEVIIIEEKP